MSPFVRQIARPNELSQFIDIFRKLTELQSIGLVNVRTMTTRSQADSCYRLRVFNANYQPGQVIILHLGFPNFDAGHVHTSWNLSDIRISLP
jgi:hypothetical protein